MGKTSKVIKKLNKNKTKKISTKMKYQLLNTFKKSSNNNNCPGRYKAFEKKLEEMFQLNKVDFFSSAYNLERNVIDKFKKALSNKEKYKPNEDFYSYINYKWLQENVKNNTLYDKLNYTPQIDDFRIVQDKVYRELNDIIVDYITNPKTKNTKKAICIKNSYLSVKKLNTHSQQQSLANSIMELFDKMRENKGNLWDIMAYLNQNEITSLGCPFIWTINPDDKNPKIYKSFINSPQVSLIDIDIYFDDNKNNAYKKRFKTRYFKYLTQLFNNAFGEEKVKKEFNVKNIFQCEYKILIAMGCNTIKTNETYNVVTKKEALNYFGFDWELFAKKMGFTQVPDEFITSNVNYLMCGTKLLLDEWNSPEWREYWIYLYIRQQQRFSVNGRKIYYDFFGIYQLGLGGLFDDTIKPIFFECFMFNTFLSQSYIEKNKNKEFEDYIKSMAEDLKMIFIRILNRNKWLQPETKATALKKLEKLHLQIGSPETLIEDPLLDYTEDDAWGNIVKKAHWRHDLAVEMINKKVIDIPIVDWSGAPPKFVGTEAYTVNAYYIPLKNQIYISQGYIQPPFIDLEQRGIEYNLAHIGFTIAHEMSHALDDIGSKYDENGVYNDWWTSSDKKKFKEIQKDVVKQYEVFALRDGIKFDAWETIGEDLADISGTDICLEYLMDFQLKNVDILPIQKLSFEMFYVYFAIQHKQIIQKRALVSQLKINPHPLDKYRTNIPLSRSIIFRSIYNVEKGDKMWWHTTNKVWVD